MGNQSFLAGDAEPLTVFMDPSVGEATAAEVVLPVVGALFPERAGHDDGVTVGFGLHPLIDDQAVRYFLAGD